MLNTQAKECASLFNVKSSTNCAAVVVAAGSSTRMGGINKLFAPIADKPVIAHTLLAYQHCPAIDAVVLATREECIADMQRVCREYGITKLKAIVPGGQTRSESVAHAMEAAKEYRYVAIADGARPLTSNEEIEATVEAAMRFGGAICAVRVHDTIKQADEGGHIHATPDRSSLWAAQTPQVFLRENYEAALSACDTSFSDDSACMENAGFSVVFVEGKYENIKITTPVDLTIAEAIWKEMHT